MSGPQLFQAVDDQFLLQRNSSVYFSNLMKGESHLESDIMMPIFAFFACGDGKASLAEQKPNSRVGKWRKENLRRLY